MLRSLRICALIAALFAGCSQPDQYLQFGAPVDVTGFIDAATDSVRHWTRPALQAWLGDPVTEVQEGTMTRLDYYGYTLQMRQDTLMSITLTDSRYVAPEGLRVGFAASQVRSRWGPPFREADTWIYKANGVMLELFFRGGAVSRIQWHLGGEP